MAGHVEKGINRIEFVNIPKDLQSHKQWVALKTAATDNWFAKLHNGVLRHPQQRKENLLMMFNTKPMRKEQQMNNFKRIARTESA